MTRARFPNGNVELPERAQRESGNKDGIVLIPGAQAVWVPPDHSLIADIVQVINQNRSEMRNGSVLRNGPVYTTYMGGIGGPCARYDPPFSYWCSSSCSGEKHRLPLMCATKHGWAWVVKRVGTGCAAQAAVHTSPRFAGV